MPLASGGVQTVSPSAQNKLLLAPSTTNPSVFSNNASSAPAASASARARICASLLQVLNCASGSFEGRRCEDVMSFQRRSEFAAWPGAGCSDITTVGLSAPLGE